MTVNHPTIPAQLSTASLLTVSVSYSSFSILQSSSGPGRQNEHSWYHHDTLLKRSRRTKATYEGVLIVQCQCMGDSFCSKETTLSPLNGIWWGAVLANNGWMEWQHLINSVKNTTRPPLPMKSASTWNDSQLDQSQGFKWSTRMYNEAKATNIRASHTILPYYLSLHLIFNSPTIAAPLRPPTHSFEQHLPWPQAQTFLVATCRIRSPSASLKYSRP